MTFLDRQIQPANLVMFWRECQTECVEFPSIARLALVEDVHILGAEGLAVDAHLVNAAIRKDLRFVNPKKVPVYCRIVVFRGLESRVRRSPSLSRKRRWRSTLFGLTPIGQVLRELNCERLSPKA